MRIKDFWFIMNIPNEPQSDNLNQIEIKRIKKPVFHKAGYQI